MKSLAVFLLCAIAALLICPLVGPTQLSFADAFGLGELSRADPANVHARIFWDTRMPRVLFAALAGAALALSGCVYQALLRNDLADSFTLGISGAAALATIGVNVLFPAGVLLIIPPIAAFIAGNLTVLLVYSLARSAPSHNTPTRLVLAGAALNLFFGAAILLTQYLVDPFRTFSMMRWLIGGLDATSWGRVAVLAGFVGVGATGLLSQSRRLNVLALGDTTAAHLGLDVRGTRVVTLAFATLLATAVVSWAGPIGFVGLIVPHALRRLLGPDHRTLLPASLLAGAAFLPVCDTIARTVLAPTELPVGVLTAFLGAPFFLWLLRKS